LEADEYRELTDDIRGNKRIVQTGLNKAKRRERRRDRVQNIIVLYVLHYSGQPEHPQQTSHVIEKAGLAYYDPQFVNGEIARLVQTGLIHGLII
jgi:uncharacterized protein (UPF0305 family)